MSNHKQEEMKYIDHVRSMMKGNLASIISILAGITICIRFFSGNLNTPLMTISLIFLAIPFCFYIIVIVELGLKKEKILRESAFPRGSKSYNLYWNTDAEEKSIFGRIFHHFFFTMIIGVDTRIFPREQNTLRLIEALERPRARARGLLVVGGLLGISVIIEALMKSIGSE